MSMFDKVKEFFQQESAKPDVSVEQAVILESDFESGIEFGLESERQQVLDFEESLKKVLSPDEEVDGHDFGEHAFIIYIYGKSADIVFENIKQSLKKSPFSRFEVTLQYGPPQDTKTQEKKFTYS
jgi:hypothetical protein